MVFCGCEDAREGEGGGDVFGADEEGVMVCWFCWVVDVVVVIGGGGVVVVGQGVEGEVEAGFVAHGEG